MKILVTGASGLIGSRLLPLLGNEGWDVSYLTRRQDPSPEAIVWNPAAGSLDPSRLNGFNAVVHLAGENIAGRWTQEKKNRIRTSRVEGTRLLCEALADVEAPPETFLAASAIGFYGHRGEERLDESAKVGEGFLAEVVRDWEAACDPLRSVNTRVVNLRIGVVLAREGGALKKMLPAFSMGLGGPIGDGKQIVSWITIDDLVRIISFILNQPAIEGPVNAVSPNPCSNTEFSKALGRVLHRPAFLPLPAFAARLLFGELAKETILCSAHVTPDKLTQSGFVFEDAEIETAFRRLLA